MPHKILVFIDWYLPGFRSGGPARSCANMVSALREEFSFYIVTRNTDYCETDPYPNVAENQWVTLPGGEQVWYLPNRDVSYKSLRQILESEKWSTVYLNGLYSRFFSIYPLLICKRNPKINVPVIVAARGMLAASAIGVKKTKKRLFLRVAKAIGLYRHVFFHATHAGEELEIRNEIDSGSKVFVVPNISQRDRLQTVPAAKIAGSLNLISIARIAPEKNLLFLLEALSAVNARVHLSIYGSVYDADYWKRCIQVISTLPGNIRVEVHGVIEPSQIPAALGKNHMLVLPSRGENFGHVIAESLVSGRPVLISDQTPWKGLEGTFSGKVIALQSEEWTKAITFFAEMDDAAFAPWLQGASQHGDSLSKDIAPVEGHRDMFRTVISSRESS